MDNLFMRKSFESVLAFITFDVCDNAKIYADGR